MESYGIKIFSAVNDLFNAGKVSVKETTDAGLLRRALDDITATGKLTNVLTSSIAPTHLILYNNIGSKQGIGTKVYSPSTLTMHEVM